MQIKVLNIGPIEWFSPHFIYNDNVIEAMEYDPLKKKDDLLKVIQENNIDAINVFRYDLVADELNGLRNIPILEWSTEIFPRTLSYKSFKYNTIQKFFHCLSKTSLDKKFVHYDSSRAHFLDLTSFSYLNHFLPVNISYVDSSLERNIDVLFFGRSSAKRYKYLSRIKELGIKFIWIENGLSFKELSYYLNRTKVVVNMPAEELDNFEPRINIALAYGALVVTEVSYGLIDFFANQKLEITSRIYTYDKTIDDFIGTIFMALSNYYNDTSLLSLFSSNKVFLECLKNAYTE